MEPDATEWKIVEPGVLMLPGTKLTIRRNNSRTYPGVYFDLFHNDETMLRFVLLERAKEKALEVMRDLTAVGIDP